MFYVALNENSCKDSEMLSRSFTFTCLSQRPSPDFKKPKILPAGFGGNGNSMDKSHEILRFPLTKHVSHLVFLTALPGSGSPGGCAKQVESQ